MEQAGMHAKANFVRVERPLSIGYVTVEDADDRRSWSGSHWYLKRALEAAGAEVVPLGPLRPQPVLFLCRVFNQVSLRLLGKRFHYRDSFVLSKAYARIISRRLRGQRVDVVLAPAGLSAIALLKTDVPIVHFNDRCLAGALEYHTILKGLLAWSREQSLALERMALKNATLTVYASEWASRAARTALPEVADRIMTLPMGANLDRMPEAPAAVAFPPEKLKLLFVGVDWVNKGGPIAYQTLQELKRRGHRAELVVCGCDVPADLNDPDLVREGFLHKGVPEKAAKLDRHFRTAHFFILPTRFEAYGIVFCEAAAYGLPALGTRTGGVSTIVLEGRTGHLFAPEQNGADYADAIEGLLQRPADWQALRNAARERFLTTLTWEAFTKALLGQVRSLLANKSDR